MLFFKKDTETDPEDFIQEKWTARFSKPEDRRFLAEKGDGYGADYEHNELVLKFQRNNIFAWVDNPWYQYRDFNLQADCSFGADGGYSALGFCFRKMNPANYYYFLISSKGFFRFDLVFNNTPQVLIPWTPFTPPDPSGGIHLRILARENSFIFLIDEEWVGEAEDDSIASGRFSWAGQNYDETESAECRLKTVEIESRPIEVEAAYYRWKDYVPVDPERRFRLAESLFLLGAYSPALIQLKKIIRLRPLAFSENLLAARAFLGSGMYPEALASAETCLKEEPQNLEALRVAGTSLYTLNKLLPLRILLEREREILKDEVWYWGLAGNCEYGLGNWKPAAEYYRKAVEIHPEEPLFRENLSRASDKLSPSELPPENEAADPSNRDLDIHQLTSCEETARLYFRSEEYEKVRGLLPKIRELDPGNSLADELEGKILFHEEEWDRAMEIFAPLAEGNKTEDSSVYFLYGLLLGGHDLRETAGRYLAKSAGMEPESFIYQFKAAESLHLQGEEMSPFLEKGLSLEPDDIWINNLAGLDALEKGNIDAALGFLLKAWTVFSTRTGPDLSISGGTDILINYTQALFEGERGAEALKILEQYSHREIHNHRGNLLAAAGDYPGAADAYEKALAQEKGNRVYRLNCVSACIEADFVHRAEELLQLFEEKDPEVYNLSGNLARIKGEFSRAETAYEEALKMDPRNAVIALNLAELYHQREAEEAAARLIEDHPGLEKSRRGRRLKAAVREAIDSSLACSLCGREWELPRMIPDQGPLKIHGEFPEDLPVGRCHSCGKIFCAACAAGPGTDGRFSCSECGEKLSINEKKILYVLRNKL